MQRRTGKAALTAVLVAACLLVAACSQDALDQVSLRTPTQRPSSAVETVIMATPEPIEASVAPEEASAPPVAETSQPTQEPTPEPATLKQGDESEEVRRLQQRLIDLGLMEGDATGYYGSVTDAAVRAFQDMFGLQADGLAGPVMQETLYSQEAEDYIRSLPSVAPASEGSGTGLSVKVQGSAQPLAGITIGLDPGHQGQGNSQQEPIAPGSSVTKPKVSSGTEGVSTHVAEYVVNLEVGLRLRDILQQLGADVVMTRETHDVDISNAERAQLFNNAGVDLAVRLHCDGEEDHSRNGAFVLIPAGEHAQGFAEQSRAAAQCVLDAFVAATGANSLGLSERDDQTGFNWSTVPVINIEMGHMSNPEEDERLVSSDYQDQCALGIAQGIVNYFA